MIIFDLLFGIIRTILNLALIYITYAIDFFWSRFFVVTGRMIEHATNDENKSQTINKISKTLYFFTELLDDYSFQQTLKKVGPKVLSVPQYLLANKQAVLDKVCNNLVFFLDYLNAAVSYLQSCKGAECVEKLKKAPDVLKTLEVLGDLGDSAD